MNLKSEHLGRRYVFKKDAIGSGEHKFTLRLRKNLHCGILFCSSVAVVPMWGQNSSLQVIPPAISTHTSSEHLSQPELTKHKQPATLTGPMRDIVVKPQDPVITVHGVCSPQKGGAQSELTSCATVVTRQEFESLVNAANVSGQEVSSAARENLARAYVTYLAFEQAAKKSGFEDTPTFATLMAFARLRAITDAYRGKIVQEARIASPAEVEHYYKEHLREYEQIDVVRITIPRNNPSAPDDKDFEGKALQIADKVRQQLIRGDDPAKVQQDAYVALKLPGVAPLDTETRKRSNLDREESDELFSLKAGGVSRVETEDAFYAVYKVTGHQPLNKAKVQHQILRALAEETIRAAFKSIGSSVQPEYNSRHFEVPKTEANELH